jgi:hypothetical protein
VHPPQGEGLLHSDRLRSFPSLRSFNRLRWSVTYFLMHGRKADPSQLPPTSRDSSRSRCATPIHPIFAPCISIATQRPSKRLQDICKVVTKARLVGTGLMRTGYYVRPRDGAQFVKLFADSQFYCCEIATITGLREHMLTGPQYPD